MRRALTPSRLDNLMLTELTLAFIAPLPGRRASKAFSG